MKLYLGTLTRYYTGVVDPDPAVVSSAVSAWRHWINKELPYALDWNESPTAPFDRAAVGETAIGALHLLARAHVVLPSEVPPDWRNGLAEPDMFRQVVTPKLWLPGEHDFLFKARELDEQLTWIGSSEELLRELGAMRHHWKAELESRPTLEADFAEACRIIERLARRSVEFRLPLRLIFDDSV